MKILFLSRSNSCRSQVAEAILRKLGPELEIWSAGLEPEEQIEPIAVEVLAEIGIRLEQKKPEKFSLYGDKEFDYLITVGDGTPEELHLPPVKARHKMHLAIHNPFTRQVSQSVIRDACREIRDELLHELDYFYHHILKKKITAPPAP